MAKYIYSCGAILEWTAVKLALTRLRFNWLLSTMDFGQHMEVPSQEAIVSMCTLSFNQEIYGWGYDHFHALFVVYKVPSLS